MTPEQIDLVKSSWEKVIPISDTAAELFYTTLFKKDPELESLFTGDIQAQGRKLMTMITTVVHGLDRLETMVPAIQDLGRRHVDYGVGDRDYDTVGEALLWTLAQGLGEEFTPEVQAAWETAYSILAATMKEAASKVA